MTAKVTILGCGGSGGIPLIGNNWGRCNPGNPKNRRRRVSVLLEHPQAKILFDTSPDLRMQMLDANCASVEALRAQVGRGVDQDRGVTLPQSD